MQGELTRLPKLQNMTLWVATAMDGLLSFIINFFRTDIIDVTCR